MSNLKTSEKSILEKLFNMRSGYVLDFSDRSMEQFLKDEFKIDTYDTKYDFDFPSKSKANRIRGIWMAENDTTVGGIILALTEKAENDLLTNDKEISPNEKELIRKARETGIRLMFPDILEQLQQPAVQNLKLKAELIKNFNLSKIDDLSSNVKIYILKVFYSYHESILRAYYGSGLYFPTSGIDDLNDYFKILRNKMIKIVESDNIFLEIKNVEAYKTLIEQITSLYNCVDFDVVWEDFIVPQMINLREEIADKDLFENSSEIHKTDMATVFFLEAIAKEIEKLNGFQKQQEKSFYREAPRQKEQFNNVFGSGKEQIHKIEIVGMPELQVKKTEEDGVLLKGNKKIHQPKFKPTDWSKINIRFLNERDVLITTDQKEVTPADYEILGFSDDKKKKPNTAWAFLFGLSKNNGETSKLPKPIPDTIKQQKLSLSQRLKAIFKNETDPFYDSTETQTYKIKIKLTPPQSEQENEDKYGTKEYLKETMIEEYEE
jgi:hypothetical protein